MIDAELDGSSSTREVGKKVSKSKNVVHPAKYETDDEDSLLILNESISKKRQSGSEFTGWWSQ